jgi:hypothetical protein
MKLCSLCGLKIDGAFYQKVVGWVADSKRDSLTGRKDVSPPQYAHPSCLKLKTLGVSEGQGVLG